jgi:shikimate kinase
METKPAKLPRLGALMPVEGTKAVFLVGFMGAGKTSVGKVLAQIFGWDFADLDERVREQEGCSIEQIFATSGESGFRIAERSALISMLQESPFQRKVVALGGGAFTSPENAAMLAREGLISVFLDASAEELFRRCEDQNVNRPLRRDLQEFRKLYEQRRNAYQHANLTVNTAGRTVKEVAAEIAGLVARGSR